MSGGSLGLRSGSNGSLQQQLQVSVCPTQTTSPPPVIRKPAKMNKDKERLLHWFIKFAGRKKVGMLFLCIVSAAVFIWVLYVGKGDDSQEGYQIHNIRFNHSLYGSLPVHRDPDSHRNSDSLILNIVMGGRILAQAPPPPLPSPLIPPQLQQFNSPFPPSVFLGYTLPSGHPCETFTLPPPPADRKRTGPRPCPVCYLPVEEAIALMPKAPSPSPILSNLTYIQDENSSKSEFGGSDFGGYPSLRQRNDSYNIRESMDVHCGFVKGISPGHQSSFVISDFDLLEMKECHGVVVASAIFGNYDIIQQPTNISEASKKNICFYMFVDEETESYLKNKSSLDNSHKIGLWRIVAVHNLPYNDARRNGKIPKLLLHRLFPNVRYSLWIDGKLQLVVDPYQILERFLWRKNASFAISKHYKRFDVFVEAQANKDASKYDNASIDFQIEFYKREGLTPYSEAKLPIISDVPEGCVIIKEHIPITNLFTCLWFNEVDRFTSRDQISFSIVRDKISSKVNWSINMFLDCERRNFVFQAYHRGLLDQMPATTIRVLPPPPPPPPPPLLLKTPTPNRSSPKVSFATPISKIVQKRSRSKKRHRKVAAGSIDG